MWPYIFERFERDFGYELTCKLFSVMTREHILVLYHLRYGSQFPDAVKRYLLGDTAGDANNH